MSLTSSLRHLPPFATPFREAWVAQDPDAIAACFREDGCLRTAWTGGCYIGRADIRNYFVQLFSQGRLVTLHRFRYFTLGNSILAISEMTMEHESLGPGQHLISTASMRDYDAEGLIVEMREFTDTSSAVRIT